MRRKYKHAFYIVQTILDSLSKQEVGITEVSRIAGLNNKESRKYIGALEYCGYVTHELKKTSRVNRLYKKFSITPSGYKFNEQIKEFTEALI